ncbi:DNA repair helicase XPB [Paenibacillus wynnii]|uniref:DNA repair helicase XPB n=1 Tax=Paenibacillus wynnii TaxID=268407 RepID=UPI00278FF00F|nr:DNA repair helicase XPB [Paenibacillus wynnii]MDQ0193143.1 DNA excision repair protein ERCC-3 [Paenibacillus wynnii]
MEGRGACVVRRDRFILLECLHTEFEAARVKLSAFAELIKSPPSYHTYRISNLSLWNAASLGLTVDEIVTDLRNLSRYEVPSGLEEEIRLIMSRYGRLTLHSDAVDPGQMILRSDEGVLLDELDQQMALQALGLRRAGLREMTCSTSRRGQLKQELTALGYPILDYAGYHEGQSLSVSWKDSSFELREYQKDAVEHFEGKAGSEGSGVIVLPCGAGKTVVGMAVLKALQCETLILTSNTTSVRQWMNELAQRTNLSADEIGEYTGEKRQVRPVTVATYQILTHRHTKGGEFHHMSLFEERNWGLIIYDEVHLLPAPVFRATADIQATRRLGLTATLVREDGREGDVFSLIGPKRYDLPWRVLEKEGWIAEVECVEMVVPMKNLLKHEYMYASAREKFRLAATNPVKAAVVEKLLSRHKKASILIIGQYIQQLVHMAEELGAPLITGKTPQAERMELYTAFNEGMLPVLVVSKVANFAVNLPDASVAIEISGAFGSRQEEAQRLGRILRPKSGENKAYFYTLVSEASREQDFSLRRRMFLTEQGYQYEVKYAELNGVDSH